MKGAEKLERMQHCSVGYSIALSVEDSSGGCSVA
jgi:hypothetical protein